MRIVFVPQSKSSAFAIAAQNACAIAQANGWENPRILSVLKDFRDMGDEMTIEMVYIDGPHIDYINVDGVRVGRTDWNRPQNKIDYLAWDRAMGGHKWPVVPGV